MNIKQALIELQDAKSNESFLILLEKCFYELAGEDRRKFFIAAVDKAYFSNFKINFLISKFFITAIGLEYFNPRSFRRYRFDKDVWAEKPFSYRCSIPSTYGQIHISFRLRRVFPLGFCISSANKFNNFGINMASDTELISPNQIVVLDIETTGLNPLLDDIIELALYDIETGESFSQLLPLIKQATLSEEISKLTNITSDMLRKEKDLTTKDIDSLIKQFNLENKTILIWSGSNMFDATFLSVYFVEKGNQNFRKLRFMNGHDLIKQFSKKYGLYNLSKDSVAKELGISLEGSHRALSDCLIEAEIYKTIYNDKNGK